MVNGAPEGAPHCRLHKLFGQEHLINDMDHAVRSLDVGGHDGRFIDHHRVADADRDFLTLNGLGSHSVGEIARHDAAGDDMVGQDRRQLILVFRFEQAFDRAFGKCRERFVGRSEDGERTFALQGLDETGSLESGGESRERTRLDRGVDDVHVLRERRAGDEHCGGGSEKRLLQHGIPP